MKLETLQTVSVSLMIAGALLAGIGGFGRHFSDRKSAQALDPRTTPAAGSIDARIAALQTRIASMEEGSPPAELPPPVAESPDVPEESLALPETARVETKTEPPPLFPALPEPARVAPKPRAAAPEAAFTAGQVEKIVQRLRSHARGVVTIRVPDGDAEAAAFAETLRKMFLAANWKAARVKKVPAERGEEGIVLSSGTFPPPPEVTTIFSALTGAGLELTTGLDPNLPEKTVVLFVGRGR